MIGRSTRCSAISHRHGFCRALAVPREIEHASLSHRTRPEPVRIREIGTPAFGRHSSGLAEAVLRQLGYGILLMRGRREQAGGACYSDASGQSFCGRGSQSNQGGNPVRPIAIAPADLTSTCDKCTRAVDLIKQFDEL